MTQIKSLDELKDLTKAVFMGDIALKSIHGQWILKDIDDALVFGDNTSDVKNWHYFEEEKEPMPDNDKEATDGE